MCIYMLYTEGFSVDLKDALIRKVITCWHELLYKFCFCREKLLGLRFSFLAETSYIWWTNLAAFALKEVIYASSSGITTYNPCSTIYSAAQSAGRIMQGASNVVTICSAPSGMTFPFSVYFRTHELMGKCFSSCEEIQVTTRSNVSHRATVQLPVDPVENSCNPANSTLADAAAEP